MNPVAVIREAINDVVGSLSEALVGFVIEHPGEESHGDYASNVAMVNFSKLGFSNPREGAEKIKVELEKNRELRRLVEKVEVAGPGFINFFLKQERLINELKQIVEKAGDYGRGVWGAGRRVLVEYSSPNIAKDFSVGHLRSTIVGQAIRNLYDFGGWETVGDNHLGDWGTQFGMIIAAVEEAGLDIERMTVSEMEQLYVEFNHRVKENESLRDLAKEAFVRLERGDEKACAIWRKSVSASMKEFDKVYKLLGVEIENAYGESAYEKETKEVIQEARDKGVAVESQGALVIKLDDLPPGMLLKSDGGTTYFTRDMATIKFREKNPKLHSDLYIYEVGAEQRGHFRQLFAAAQKLGWVENGKLMHVAHGLILGKDGKKMSTRKGTGVKMEELLSKVIEKAGKFNKQVSKQVGVGAVKYFDLRHNPESAYRFDWDEALSLEGNSGPYLQYTYARIRSVVGRKRLEWKDGVVLSQEESDLLRWLYRFSEVVEMAAKEFSPNLVCSYLFELASRFNTFYNKHRILQADTDKQKRFRLLLTAGVGQVIKNGLNLLGIEAVEKM